MKNVKRTIVEETNMGLYGWMIDGKLVGDDEGNFLTVPAVKGDVKKINALRDAVYGFLRELGLEPQGKPVFLAGRRQITDEEYEEQVTRQKWGLIPDPLDVPAMQEELEYNKRYNK
jgi:hypothetical protein